MIYQVYVDILFLMNLVMNLFLLFCVKRALKIAYTWKRTILGALTGALFSCLLLFTYGISEILKFMISYFGLPLLMVWTGFSPIAGRQWKKLVLVLYGMTLLLGGIVFFLQYKWSMSGGKALFFSMAIQFIGLEIFSRIKDRKRNLYRVNLKVEGEMISVKGLYDTGNLLVCPWDGKEVYIIDETYLENVKNLKEYRIPFSSVGKEKGLLRAVQISAMSVVGDDGKMVVKTQPVIGLGAKALFENRSYQMILHSNTFK